MFATCFALLAGAAGWYYMFYSRAAEKLGGVEGPRTNRRRVALRRVGGGMMFLLGVCFFAGYRAVEQEWPGVAGYLIWMAVMVLLLGIVALGAIDLWMTRRLRV